MATCFIGIGSNLGDRRKNIKLAINKINQLKDTKVVKASTIIETMPAGGPPQGKYLNTVVEIQTGLSPRALLNDLQDIELALGRVRTVKNAARTIDLDILIFDKQKICEKDLVLPHPRIRERDFVFKPLEEIAPQIVKELFNEDNQED